MMPSCGFGDLRFVYQVEVRAERQILLTIAEKE